MLSMYNSTVRLDGAALMAQYDTYKARVAILEGELLSIPLDFSMLTLECILHYKDLAIKYMEMS